MREKLHETVQLSKEKIFRESKPDAFSVAKKPNFVWDPGFHYLRRHFVISREALPPPAFTRGVARRSPGRGESE